MKFKYPKKITIGETKFHIKYDKKSQNGAKFCYPDNGKKAFIKFGMMNHKANPLEFLSMIIHELKEIIQIEQGVRFYNHSSSNNYHFTYNHQQHSDTCCRLTELLVQFIK